MTKRALLLLALAIVAAEPLLFWNAFAGDAEVHLVFMESASRGHFFEFNPGEPVSGETSPGYMLLGAALFRLLPSTAVPIALKVIGLLAWYAHCLLVWRAATRIFAADVRDGSARVWATIAAVVTATIAGSVYNANAGMENGLFAALVWGWITLVSRWRCLDSGAPSIRRELVASLILGIAAWFRPEALIVAIVAWAFRMRRAHARAIPFATLLITLMVGGLGFAFEASRTGDLVPISMLSRHLVAMPNTFALGPLAIDPTLAVRLLVYFPLTALFLVDARRDPTAPTSPLERRFLDLLLAVFFVLYTLGGTPHLSRYLIFLMPILVIGAASGARRLWRLRTRSTRVLVALAGLAIAVIAAVEPSRRTRLYPPYQLASMTAAPASRRTHTDELLQLLGQPSHPPLIVALESVQIRYEVDERVVVRSLDGRVDPLLFRYVGRGTVDHVGYLRARRADALLEAPSYNRDHSSWSLAVLRELLPGEVVARDGLQFRRLASKKAIFALSAAP